MNIYVHGTILGPGGIAHHTREFTKRLAQHHNVKFRNFNIPSDWRGYTGPGVLKSCDELDASHHKMLNVQTLQHDGGFKDFPLTGFDGNFVSDVNLIMAEANHYYYYENYTGIKVAYFPWETTQLRTDFFERLDYFDYVWVPSNWQRDILINQGMYSDKMSVVPEGVDETIFYPKKSKQRNKFTTLHIGTWEYRKSTYEIVNAWQSVFGDDSNVELRLSINNKFRDQENEVETFKKFGLDLSDNIVFLDTLSEDEYVKEIRNADLYISCARGEGWNLPLIQAMASGVPSIYSKCGGQLEFTENMDIGIDIISDYPCTRKTKINGQYWNWQWGQKFVGNLYEPDYRQLKSVLGDLYNSIKNNNMNHYKQTALTQSEKIRREFSWDNAVTKANKFLSSYMNTNQKEIYYKVHSRSFGDTLAATPTLRYLARSYGRKINVVAHNTKAFQNNPNVKQLISFDEFDKLKHSGEVLESFTSAGRRDVRGIEKKFAHIDLRQTHAMDLGFQLLPDDMEYEFYPNDPVPDFGLPDEYVVLHVTSNWPNRTWDYTKWRDLIQWLNDEQIYTVLIGQDYNETLHSSVSDTPLEKTCPTFDSLYGTDLTNKGSLDDMWYVINNAKCIVTMDTGPLHIAGTTDTHIIQLGSAIHPALRAPYRNGDQNYKYDYVMGTCDLFCNSNLKYNVKEWDSINAVPPLHGCLEGYTEFKCHPIVNDVKKSILKLIAPRKSILEYIRTNKNENYRIEFNYNESSDSKIHFIAYDSLTGFKSDTLVHKHKRNNDGFYWWSINADSLYPRDVKIEVYKDDILIENYVFKRNKPISVIINDIEVNDKIIKINDNIDEIYLTFWEVFIQKTYENKLVKVEENDIVLDVGTNYGFFSLYAIQQGAKKVYSFEPDIKCYDSLKQLSDNFSIIPVNKAIYSKGDTVLFNVSNNKSALNHVKGTPDYLNNKNKLTENEVSAIHINEVLNNINETVDLIKLDCEGSELDIIESISDEHLSKIKKFIMEIHSNEIKKIITNRLLSAGFELDIITITPDIYNLFAYKK